MINKKQLFYFWMIHRLPECVIQVRDVIRYRLYCFVNSASYTLAIEARDWVSLDNYPFFVNVPCINVMFHNIAYAEYMIQFADFYFCQLIMVHIKINISGIAIGIMQILYNSTANKLLFVLKHPDLHYSNCKGQVFL